MVAFLNDWEGIPSADQTALTAAISDDGGGTAISSIASGGTGSTRIEKGAANVPDGTVAVRCQRSAAADIAGITVSIFSGTMLRVRAKIRLPQAMASEQLLSIRSNTNALMARIQTDTSNRIVVVNRTGAALFTSAALPSYPCDITLDFAVQVGTTGTAPVSTDGKVRFQYFLGRSQVPAQVMADNNATDTGLINVGIFQLGLISGAATVGSVYIDDVAADDTGLGPLGPFVFADPTKVADRGTVTNVTAGATSVVGLASGAAIAVGNYLIARVAVDNTGSSGALPGLTMTDPKGNTWTVATGGLADPGAASAGIATYIAYCKVTAAYANADNLTFNWTTGTPAAKAIVVEEWANINGTVPIDVAAVTATGAASPATAAITPTVGKALVYVACGVEGIIGDTYTEDVDTTSGAWVSLTRLASADATALNNALIEGGYKVVSASGAQSWSATITARDWATVAVSFAPAGAVIQTASVALTATSTLTAAPSLGQAAAVALTATSTLTATGTVTPPPAVTQAAYRFYADGTETGSVALAAENTGYTADLTNGDVNLLLRIRLQSTNAADIPATDDFTLQWEKNASGTWLDVGGGASTVDSYSDTVSGFTSLVGAGTFKGQSFIGSGTPLDEVRFWLSKIGTPPGNIRAVVYAHTGTYGTDTGLGVNPGLSSSLTSMACTALASSPQQESFVFSGLFVPVNGTPYVIGVEVDGATDISNCPRLATGPTIPTARVHPGSAIDRIGATTWDYPYGNDRLFVVYGIGAGVVPYASPSLTDGAATTARLTAGTGTFVPGKVAEDERVDNLGVTGNNYTEVLYAITMKRVDLLDGDTVRFRVIDSNAQVVETYTQTPTIPIVVRTAAALAVTATIGATASVATAAKQIDASLPVTATIGAAVTVAHPVGAVLAVTATIGATAASTGGAAGPLKTFNCEGGTPGATVTTSDTGSGDLITDRLFVGTPTLAYSTAQVAHGSKSVAIIGVATTQQASLGWLGYTASDLSVRFYFRLNSHPVSGTDLMQIRHSGNAVGMKLALALTGGISRVTVQDRNGTTIFDPGNALGALSLNTWYRCDVRTVRNTATVGPFNGIVQVDVYSGDSTTPLYTGTSLTNVDNNGASATNTLAVVRIGKPATAGGTLDGYIDDLAAQDNLGTYIGPAAGGVTQAVTASLAVTATIGAAGLVTRQAAVVLSATSTLTATPVAVVSAAVSLSATSTLSATPVGATAMWNDTVATWSDPFITWNAGQVSATVTIGAGLAVTATIGATGAATFPAQAAPLAVTASITATGSLTKPVTAVTVAATATITAGAVRAAPVGTGLAVSATITTTAAVAEEIAATVLAVTATITGGVSVTRSIGLTLAITASLTSTAVVTKTADAVLTVTAIIGAATTPTLTVVAALPVSATITAAGLVTKTVTAALAATATIGAVPAAAHPVDTALVATATLTATALRAAPVGAVLAVTASTSATMVLATTVQATRATTVTITTGLVAGTIPIATPGVAVTATITSTARVPTLALDAALPVTATIGAAAVPTRLAVGALSVAATITTTAALAAVLTAALPVSATVTAGAVAFVGQAAGANLPVTATLTATASQVTVSPAGAVLVIAASLTGTIGVTRPIGATLAVVATVTATAVAFTGQAAGATLAVTASRTVTAGITRPAGANLFVTASAAAAVVITRPVGTALLIGVSITASTDVAAGGPRFMVWFGDHWEAKPAFRWDGSEWVPAKVAVLP